MNRRLCALFALLAIASLGHADAKTDHWAWKPPVRPAVPLISGSQPANTIDAFVRARLEKAGIAPAPIAKREQLIRRVTFDLTGLPPTPDEVDAFINDHSP